MNKLIGQHRQQHIKNVPAEFLDLNLYIAYEQADTGQGLYPDTRLPLYE